MMNGNPRERILRRRPEGADGDAAHHAITARVEHDRGVFMISVAAELAEMHPQTLRMYEPRGLIEPQRSPKGTRLYSQADVERLRRIQEMTTELGMNLAGVERVFELEDAARPDAAQGRRARARAPSSCRTRSRASRRSAARSRPRSCATRRRARRSSRSGTSSAQAERGEQRPAVAREDRAALLRPGQQRRLGERLGERGARRLSRGGDHAGPR